MLKALLAMVALAMASQASATPGVYLEESASQPAMFGKPATTETMRTWMAEGHMRVDQGDPGTTLLVDVAAGTMTVVDHGGRSYFTLDREGLRQMDRLGAALMVGEPEAGKTTEKWTRETGRTRTIGPWKAREVVMEDRPLPGTKVVLWLSRDVPIDPALRREAAAVGADPTGGPLASLMAQLRELEGYPVEMTVSLRVGGVAFERTQRLSKVERRELDASVFAVPKDYRQTDNPLAGLGAPGGGESGESGEKAPEKQP